LAGTGLTPERVERYRLKAEKCFEAAKTFKELEFGTSNELHAATSWITAGPPGTRTPLTSRLPQALHSKVYRSRVSVCDSTPNKTFLNCSAGREATAERGLSGERSSLRRTDATHEIWTLLFVLSSAVDIVRRRTTRGVRQAVSNELHPVMIRKIKHDSAVGRHAN
jgi:hypothetical protein